MANSPFLESIRHVMKTKHYSIQTEKTYLSWIKRFILFNHKRHPKDLGEKEVTQFLTHLAVNREVISSTQNLALCAIVFRGKGGKDRTTMLPKKLIEPLKAQVEKVQMFYKKCCASLTISNFRRFIL